MSFVQTFNWRDIRLELLFSQILRLEPISHDQLPTGVQQLGSILEEKLLVRKMAYGLRDPHTIELGNIWLCVEEVTHLLGIELDEADRAVAQLEGVSCPILLSTACLQCQLSCDFNLPAANGHSRDLASVVFSQMTGCSTDSTANIQDRASLRQCGSLKQKLDQLNLGLLLGIGRSEEVAMVNVLAPSLSVNSAGDWWSSSARTTGYNSSQMQARSDV